MPELSMLFIATAALASLTGFGWIALTIGPHWKQVGAQTPLSPAMRRRLRLQGSLALSMALGLCLGADSPGMAALLWTMLLSLGATGIALLLAWRPHWLNPLAR